MFDSMRADFGYPLGVIRPARLAPRPLSGLAELLGVGRTEGIDGDRLAGTYWPAALYVPAMSVGWTRTPSLAIVAYTLAICTALTETPCP